MAYYSSPTGEIPKLLAKVPQAPNIRTILNLAERTESGAPIVPGFDFAPTQQEPSQSGFSGSPSLPARDGAFLGYLSATTDRNMDVWADALQPYTAVSNIVDEVAGSAAQRFDLALDAWANAVLGCDSTICEWLAALLALLLAAIVGTLFPPAAFAAAVLLTIWITAGDTVIKETAEDVISGCNGTLLGDLLISLAGGSAFCGEAEESVAKEDHAFFTAMSVSNPTCENIEDGFVRIEDLRLYGYPDKPISALLSPRARMADAALACDSHGVINGDETQEVDAAQCAADTSLLSKHFLTVEPWVLSAESAKRAGLNDYKCTGQNGQPRGCAWERWRMSSFTSNGHFMDLLSPPTGYPDIAFASVPITAMKAQRHGKRDSFDGYSVAPDTDFIPVPDVIGSLPIGQTNAFGIELGGAADTVQTASQVFNLRAAPPSGYTALRRRVCADPQMAGLVSDDGLGFTDCARFQPDATSGDNIVTMVHAPADLAVLDGFSSFIFAERPAALSYYSVPDAGGQRTLLTHPYVEQFLPLAVFQAQHGLPLPSSGPYPCDPLDPITCPGTSNEFIAWMESANNDPGARLALGLRGLGTALHMLQDLTVPHHVAPTSGFGHVDYEGWAEAWIFPRETELKFSQMTVDISLQGGRPITQTGDKTVDTIDHNGISSTYDGYWGFDLGDPRASGTVEAVAEEIMNAAASPMARWTTSFWADRVTPKFDELDQNMAALASGSSCSDFSARRLAWSVAYKTAAVAQAARSPLLTGSAVTQDVERNTFFIFSALAPALKEGCDEPPYVLGMPTWDETLDELLPLAVAAGTRLLIEGAKARLASDPTKTTCTKFPHAGPSDDSATIVNIDGRSCLSDRNSAIQECFNIDRDPFSTSTNPICTSLAGLPSFEKCKDDGQKLVPELDRCGDVAAALASCICTQWGTGAFARNAAADAYLEQCTASTTALSRLLDLLSAGLIDQLTYQHLSSILAGGTGQLDSDSDGIPDASDRCPNVGGGGAPDWNNTGLSIGVCWLKIAGCPYGCTSGGATSE